MRPPSLTIDVDAMEDMPAPRRHSRRECLARVLSEEVEIVAGPETIATAPNSLELNYFHAVVPTIVHPHDALKVIPGPSWESYVDRVGTLTPAALNIPLTPFLFSLGPPALRTLHRQPFWQP